MSWLATFTDSGIRCVVPLDDLREHDPKVEHCWCRPTLDDGVLVHHSMDRREEYEQGRKPS